MHTVFHPTGSTDSEHALCWLMYELAKKHASLPLVEHLTQTMLELVPEFAQDGSSNFLLSNRQGLRAHCSTKLHSLERAYPSSKVQLRDDELPVNFAPWTTQHDRVVITVTEPLTTNQSSAALNSGELAVCVDGRRGPI